MTKKKIAILLRGQAKFAASNPVGKLIRENLEKTHPDIEFTFFVHVWDYVTDHETKREMFYDDIINYSESDTDNINSFIDDLAPTRYQIEGSKGVLSDMQAVFDEVPVIKFHPCIWPNFWPSHTHSELIRIERTILQLHWETNSMYGLMQAAKLCKNYIDETGEHFDIIIATQIDHYIGIADVDKAIARAINNDWVFCNEVTARHGIAYVDDMIFWGNERVMLQSFQVEDTFKNWFKWYVTDPVNVAIHARSERCTHHNFWPFVFFQFEMNQRQTIFGLRLREHFDIEYLRSVDDNFKLVQYIETNNPKHHRRDPRSFWVGESPEIAISKTVFDWLLTNDTNDIGKDK